MGGRVLVGCELSGVVRRAFERAGCEAWSCDLEVSEDGGGEWGRHIVGDVRQAVAGEGPWDLMVCHPPCQRLAVSGARWMAGREDEIEEALELVRWLLIDQQHVPRVCLENPVGLISTRVRKPDQIIQPWQFGHGECKKTCLWFRNLPELRYTKKVPGRLERVAYMPKSKDRARLRSRTYEGIAAAMASQWGPLLA